MKKLYIFIAGCLLLCRCFAMNSVVCTTEQRNFITDTTGYYALQGASTGDSNSNRAMQLISAPGTFTAFYMRITTAPGEGASYTVTLVVNDIDTELEFTIANTDTTGSDTGSVAVVAGDKVYIKIVSSTDPAPASSGNHQWTLYFSSTNAKESNFMGASNDYAPGAAQGTEYNVLNAMQSWNNSTLNDVQLNLYFPTAGTLKNFYIQGIQAPGAGNTATYTIMKNGVATDLVVEVSDTNTSGSNTTDTVDIAVGDRIIMSCSVDTGNGIGYTASGITFEADVDGESVLSHSTSGIISTSDNYNSLCEGSYVNYYGSSEDAGHTTYYMPSCTLTSYYLAHAVDPDPGSIDSNVVVNGVENGDLSLSITTGNTDNYVSGKSVSVSSGNNISVRAIGNSVGTRSYTVQAVTMYIAPPAGGNEVFGRGIGVGIGRGIR